MAKWELAIVRIDFDGTNVKFSDHSGQVGPDQLVEGGWELVSVAPVDGIPLAFFKRPVQKEGWKPIAGVIRMEPTYEGPLYKEEAAGG